MSSLRILLVGIIIFNSAAVSAQEISLIGHGFSYHLQNSNKVNQDNYGLGIRLDYSNFGIQGGSYINSYSNQSNYLLLDINLIDYKTDIIRVEAGPMVAIASGYPDYSPIGVGIQAAIHYDNFFMRVRALPAVNSVAVGAIEIGLRVFKW